MTPPDRGATLIGREPVLTVLRSSTTAVMTGLGGSGLTSVLDATTRALLDSGTCVVANTPAPRPDAVPLSYLSGLSVLVPGRSGDRSGPGLPLPGTSVGDPATMVPVPLQDLPWFVERTAHQILDVSAGHRVALVLDDLDAADALSLSALPLLQLRLRARLLGAGHAPSPGVYPRVALGALLDRLHRPSRVHLSGLDDDQCLQLARLRNASASPALVEAVRPALGTWGCLPGLFLGVVDEVLAGRPSPGAPYDGLGSGRLRLPDDHSLVRALLARGVAATTVAAASAAGGLYPPDLELLATVLGAGPDRLAETVDDLTAEGLLEFDNGLWRCTLPALAATLADLALPSATLVALASDVWSGRTTATSRPPGTSSPVPAPVAAASTALVTVAVARPDLPVGPSQHRPEAAHRLTALAGRAGAALPIMLNLLVDVALAEFPGQAEPVTGSRTAPDPPLRARLLAAIADAVERALPDQAVPVRPLRLAETMLLASVSGEERTSLRIAAAGIRLLRRTADVAQSRGEHTLACLTRRDLVRLREVASTLPPPVTDRTDPRPRCRGASTRRRFSSGWDTADHLASGDGSTASPETAVWTSLLLTRRTLGLAADGDSNTWSAAWRRWQEAYTGPVPPVDAQTVRALAGWGSRRELLTALNGHPPRGPVTAYLNGDWDLVSWAGRQFLAAAPIAHRSAEPPEHDDLIAAALALLVAVDQRENRIARTLYRRLAYAARGQRPPVLSHALTVAALARKAEPSSSPCDRGELDAILRLVEDDLRQARRTGPRNGLDLLLFAASRLNAVLRRPVVTERLTAELSDLADNLATARAMLLAARARLPAGLPSPGKRTRPDTPPNASGGTPAPDDDANRFLATIQLRRALALPVAEFGLGTLGRAQAMVMLAEQLPPDDTETLGLATGAVEALAPLRATEWLTRARALLPSGGTPGTGARRRATADQVRIMIAEGLTNRQISTRLSLSEKSVEGYVTRLLREHSCANRAELAARRPEPRHPSRSDLSPA